MLVKLLGSFDRIYKHFKRCNITDRTSHTSYLLYYKTKYLIESNATFSMASQEDPVNIKTEDPVDIETENPTVGMNVDVPATIPSDESRSPSPSGKIKKQNKFGNSKIMKKRTHERDISVQHFSTDDMIKISLVMFSDFIASHTQKAIENPSAENAEETGEKRHVEVQCSENWGDSMFVYDVPQDESTPDSDGPGTKNESGEAGNTSAAHDGDLAGDQVGDKDVAVQPVCDKRKATEDPENKELKRAKLETKALKAKRPGFTDERYNETSYYIENGLRKVYPYYFTFTTFTKGRWVGEKILDVFAREFRAHPAEEYERCIRSGSLTVNYERVDVDYKLKHNDLLANVVHRHEVPVTADPISIVHMDEDVVVVNKPASIPVHPCGRYRHNTVVFILAKEYNLKNLRTIHRLDRLTSGLLMFGRTPKKARTMEQQIRNRQVQKEYVCRVEGQFPCETIECDQPIEVVSYKIGVCKVSEKGKTCSTTFKLLGYHAPTNTSVVLCLPHSGRMHQIRVHLQFLGYPVVNDPLYNHEVFGPLKGRGGLIGKTDSELVRDLIRIHNAENWLGVDADLSMLDEDLGSPNNKCLSREPSPCEVTPSSPPCLSTSSIPLYANNNNGICSISRKKVTVATQTGHEAPDLSFDAEKLTTDPHCYECKVRYRDPKPQDLVMFLHAWKYRGPGWAYQTELPDWARIDWTESVD